LKITILIHCKDQVGIISAVTSFLHKTGGNVIYLDQHVDKVAGVFFMRLEAEFEQQLQITEFERNFRDAVASVFAMKYNFFLDGKKPNMAIFVSKYNHCLYDLLSRHQAGELEVNIPFIISNHNTLAPIAKQFDIPFFHVAVTKDTKSVAEGKQLDLLQKFNIDFIVLARYMQIVSGKIITHFTNKIINIHHSFLPAFAGAKPYHAAFARGVKIIGATSHYVTEELDAGPIIQQDVTAVSHAHNVQDYIAKGRDLEKIVLAKAVQLHVQRKTMVYNNKTVIFT